MRVVKQTNCKRLRKKLTAGKELDVKSDRRGYGEVSTCGPDQIEERESREKNLGKLRSGKSLKTFLKLIFDKFFLDDMFV